MSEIIVGIVFLGLFLGGGICVVRIGLMVVEANMKYGFNYFEQFRFYKSKSLGEWVVRMLAIFFVAFSLGVLLLKKFPDTYSISVY